MCTHEDHVALKADPVRVEAETVFVAAQYFDGELFGHLHNCVGCGSTILVKPEVSGAGVERRPSES